MDKLQGIFYPALHVPIAGLDDKEVIPAIPNECPEGPSDINGCVEWIVCEAAKTAEMRPLLDARVSIRLLPFIEY
jgi:hypothetical protein